MHLAAILRANEHEPLILDLNNIVEIPIYLSGLDSYDIYDNNIINVDFTSLDLLEVGKGCFHKNQATNDLNSINPIYIDYINAN